MSLGRTVRRWTDCRCNPWCRALCLLQRPHPPGLRLGGGEGRCLQSPATAVTGGWNSSELGPYGGRRRGTGANRSKWEHCGKRTQVSALQTHVGTPEDNDRARGGGGAGPRLGIAAALGTAKPDPCVELVLVFISFGLLRVVLDA